MIKRIPASLILICVLSELVACRSKDNHGSIAGPLVAKLLTDAGTNGLSGLALVESGDKFGYIDRKGAYVINPQFDLGRVHAI
jgi:hypothetical protein